MATFVVVHGAWTAGWSWKKMHPLMAERGHRLITPTMTGLGERAHLARPDVDLETHIADILGVLEFEELSSVNLIGHSPTHGGEITLEEGEQLIVAPMVGTFYSAPAPNEPPYVAEGHEIEPSTIVGIIEAMKMMNEIEAEVGGRIVRILVQNAQPVEYGQPLMVVSTGA